MIPAAGSRWQREAGVEDSPELFMQDILAKTRGRAHRGMAEVLTQAAPETVHWLVDHGGVPLFYAGSFQTPGHSRPRMHSVGERSGSGLLAALLAGASARPEITLLQSVRLQHVEVSTSGVMLETERPSGAKETIEADSVVLATAGYGANADLVAKLIPNMASSLYYGGHGSQGDALAIGAELHADVEHLGAYQGYTALAMPHRVRLSWVAIEHGGYLVNTEGKRFCDESEGWAPDHCEAIAAQPGGFGWAIFDERIRALCNRYEDFKELETLGGVSWADDEGQLAELIGAPETALHQTIQAAKGAATGTAEDALGRERFEEPLRPPYAAVKVYPALFHTQGGLVTDGAGRVLRAGMPIGGVYAAGGAAVGMSGPDGSGYLPGNGLLSALALGRLAG